MRLALEALAARMEVEGHPTQFLQKNGKPLKGRGNLRSCRGGSGRGTIPSDSCLGLSDRQHIIRQSCGDRSIEPPVRAEPAESIERENSVTSFRGDGASWGWGYEARDAGEV